MKENLNRNHSGLYEMKFELSMEDYTILINALHYYKKVEKKGNFQQYDEKKINSLRDKMAKQITNLYT